MVKVLRYQTAPTELERRESSSKTKTGVRNAVQFASKVARKLVYGGGLDEQASENSQAESRVGEGM